MHAIRSGLFHVTSRFSRSSCSSLDFSSVGGLSLSAEASSSLLFSSFGGMQCFQWKCTGWGDRLRKMFCNMFSGSSTGSWAELQLPCSQSKQGELSENISQNLQNKWLPHPVYLHYIAFTRKLLLPTAQFVGVTFPRGKPLRVVHVITFPSRINDPSLPCGSHARIWTLSG